MSAKPENTRRSRDGRWVKGASANPGGRPSTPREVIDFIGCHTLEAAKRLVEIMRGKDPQQARLAAEALLDRRLGKPAIAMNVSATRLTEMPPEFVGAAAGILERALAEVERTSTDAETVALPGKAESERQLTGDGAESSPTVVPPGGGS